MANTCNHQWRSPLSHTCIYCGFVDEGAEHMGAVEFPGGEPRQPLDEQTRLEQELYALKVAYQLVRDDVQRRFEARERFANAGNVAKPHEVIWFLDARLEQLQR